MHFSISEVVLLHPDIIHIQILSMYIILTNGF